jgi:hypothetical protein
MRSRVVIATAAIGILGAIAGILLVSGGGATRPQRADGNAQWEPPRPRMRHAHQKA